MPGVGVGLIPVGRETNRAPLSSARGWCGSPQRESRHPNGSHAHRSNTIAVQVVVLGNAAGSARRSRRPCRTSPRYVAELFQHGVHIGLDVAGAAGVAVPVPGAAHVGRSIDTARFRTKLAPAAACQPHSTPPADDRHVDRVDEWLARECSPSTQRVLGEIGELARIATYGAIPRRKSPRPRSSAYFCAARLRRTRSQPPQSSLVPVP